MSGSAGVAVLEEHVLYTYQESARRKLRPEEYDDYFRGRREGMLGAIQHAQPQFNQWRKAVSAAGIKLKPVPVFAELDGEHMIRVELSGERGSTELANPAASKFNFFGPLFDQHGGRTSKRFGVVSVSMLFLSNSKGWETDTKFGINRGPFETWFGQVLKND